ncbi:MAG TPA: hypothetical protein VG371_03930 [Solirubrobacteraceae bacterium]|nr:hypothetical protein [Solirubrobacteraceae bacterium]
MRLEEGGDPVNLGLAAERALELSDARNVLLDAVQTVVTLRLTSAKRWLATRARSAAPH